MSIKKLLGKVAVGAAVGALVIAGAVVMVTTNTSPLQMAGKIVGLSPVMAQMFPSDSLGITTNPAAGLAHTSGELSIEYNVDLRAYLYAQAPTAADAAKDINDTTWLVDSIRAGGGTGGNVPIGNVGRVWVETNYPYWDVVATLKNGGNLFKVLSDEELIPRDTQMCAPAVGFSEPRCSTVTVYNNGKALMCGKSGTTEVPCSLVVGIGIGNWNGTAAITNQIVMADTILSFDSIPGSISKKASFARSLGTVPYIKDSVGLFLDTAMVSGTDSIQYKGFPQIKGGAKVGLASGVFGETPKEADYHALFIINAAMKHPIKVGNANGKYTETMEFQFWGLY